MRRIPKGIRRVLLINSESQLAEGKHTFLKKVDENFLLLLSFIYL